MTQCYALQSESGMAANKAAAAAMSYASAFEVDQTVPSPPPPPPPPLPLTLGGEPELKRSKSLEEWAGQAGSGFALAATGEEGSTQHFVPRTQESVTVRHGSSLDLIRQGHMLINAEFNETDPEKDFKKWQDKGASPYFFAVVEESGIVSCCLRCLLDGYWESYWPSGRSSGRGGVGIGDAGGRAAKTSSGEVDTTPSSSSSSSSYISSSNGGHNSSGGGNDLNRDTLNSQSRSQEGSFQEGSAEGCSGGGGGGGGGSGGGGSGDDGVINHALSHCTRRVVVDYVVTLEQCQGRGHASHLLKLVGEVATSAGANLYVLALEDSCVYWMSKGFILETEKGINRRLNVFPDTHLLRLPSNAPEHSAHLPPPPPDSSSSSSSSEGKPNDGGSGSDEDNDDDDEGGKEDDDELAAALAESASIAESKAMAESLIASTAPSSLSSSFSSSASASLSSSSSSSSSLSSSISTFQFDFSFASVSPQAAAAAAAAASSAADSGATDITAAAISAAIQGGVGEGVAPQAGVCSEAGETSQQATAAPPQPPLRTSSSSTSIVAVEGGGGEEGGSGRAENTSGAPDNMSLLCGGNEQLLGGDNESDLMKQAVAMSLGVEFGVGSDAPRYSEGRQEQPLSPSNPTPTTSLQPLLQTNLGANRSISDNNELEEHEDDDADVLAQAIALSMMEANNKP